MKQLVESWIQLNKRTLSVITILKLAAGRDLCNNFSYLFMKCLLETSNWITDLSDVENKEKKRILKLRKKLEAVEAESYDAISQSLREVLTPLPLVLIFLNRSTQSEVVGIRDTLMESTYRCPKTVDQSNRH